MFNFDVKNSVFSISERKHLTVNFDDGESIVYMIDFRTSSSSITWLDNQGDIITQDWTKQFPPWF